MKEAINWTAKTGPRRNRQTYIRNRDSEENISRETGCARLQARSVFRNKADRNQQLW